MEALYNAALEPHGVTVREVGVLLTIAGGEPPSQQQAARQLGVDRTTMVAILDALEAKQLVLRRPGTEDRRRNVIELTPAGERTLRAAVGASDDAEATALKDFDETAIGEFRDLLRKVATSSGE